MLPGPWQGQNEKGDHPQQPIEGSAKEGQRSGAPPAARAHRQPHGIQWVEEDVAGGCGMESAWMPGCSAWTGTQNPPHR